MAFYNKRDPDLLGVEAQIMEAAKHDPAAFSPIYESYFMRVFAYCQRRVGNYHDAEDLTSVIFTRALLNLKDYRGGQVSAWLFRIARSTVADHYRRARSAEKAGRTTSLTLDDDAPNEDTQPLDRLILSEEQAVVREFVGALDDDERELIALRISAGLSADEVGKVLGKSAGSVRVGVHRLIKRLRGDLRRWFDAEQKLEVKRKKRNERR